MRAILKSVSRSFYLTIRFLPRALREPVGLAYLLARATDTVADTAEIAMTFRLTTLLTLGRVIAGKTEFGTVAGPLGEFAARQTDPHERRLIESLPACIAQLLSLAADDRDDIRTVLGTIVRGQELDLRRFGASPAVTSLSSATELEEYTYLVAGCVGEFWTRLGFRHCPPFATRAPNEMAQLGAAYGQGLQLINVLRDTGADLQAGRRYLPTDELALAPFREVFARWLTKAETQLEAGIEYCLGLTNWRLRFATALPALIGARTLALLRLAGDEVVTRRIKVSRAEVRSIAIRGFIAARSPARSRALFEQLRGSGLTNKQD